MVTKKAGSNKDFCEKIFYNFFKKHLIFTEL